MKRYILPLLVLIPLAWILGAFESLSGCDYCGGESNVVREECWDCHPAYREHRVNSRLKKVVRVAPAVFWVAVILSVPGGILWGLIAIDCRFCRADGTLTLEAIPPGGPAFEVQVACPDCHGYGRVGTLDSWVYRMGWD